MFCLLAPDGRERLSKSHRGPEMVLGRRSAAEKMYQYSFWYPPTADLSKAIVQDFHSVRQALNVASADQRVLVIVHASAEQASALRESLRAVANDPRVIGRFHFDFDQGDSWKQTLDGTSEEHGILLVNPGEFGLRGTVMQHLPLDTDNSEIVSALIKANAQFAATTEKKVYSQHVAKGRAAGIYFEGAVPYGEDRDGDGQIDRGRSSERKSHAGNPRTTRSRARQSRPSKSSRSP